MEYVKHAVDGLSIGAVIATLAGWLPPIAAALAIIWTTMQIVMNYRKFIGACKKICASRKVGR